MMPAWSIRAASLGDLDDLVEIENTQFPEPWSRTLLKEELELGHLRRYSVAVENKKVIGVLGLMLIDEDAHINTIASAQGHEGRGVARSLLDEALPVISAQGFTRITLEVAVGNARARDLYTRYGFAPLGIRKQYYRTTGEDALVLVKYLSN